MYNLIKNQLVP